jgi:hypothetical protein
MADLLFFGDGVCPRTYLFGCGNDRKDRFQRSHLLKIFSILSEARMAAPAAKDIIFHDLL